MLSLQLKLLLVTVPPFRLIPLSNLSNVCIAQVRGEDGRNTVLDIFHIEFLNIYRNVFPHKSFYRVETTFMVLHLSENI